MEPLTLAFGATIASSRPRAFCLPSLLVGGAKLFAFYKKMDSTSVFDCDGCERTKAHEYPYFDTFIL